MWSLEQWKRGECELMDEGSQCVVLACEAAEGEAVLDMCAGNGGKALALAALVGDSGSLLAHDVVESRLAALRASAERASVSERITTVLTGGEGLEQACDRRFDLVLVDAPCSSSGTLRRHPGLRWGGLWTRAHGVEERERLVALQRSLLERALSMTRPGGRLVYATCSLDHEENERVADAFAGSAIGAECEPWPFADGVAGRHDRAPHYRTLWPHRHGTDGFFIARWRVPIE